MALCGDAAHDVAELLSVWESLQNVLNMKTFIIFSELWIWACLIKN